MPTWFDDTVFRPPTAEERQAARDEVLVELKHGQRGDRLILFVGRLEMQKDPGLLIGSFEMAAAADPRVRLLIVGDGGLRRDTEVRAETSSWAERIHFLGWRSRPAIARLMSASDTLLLTSRFEGMPITVLEAMATGLPVVATAVGEVPRLVSDGVSGWLAADRTPESVAEALARLLAADAGSLSKGAQQAAAPYSSTAVLAPFYDAHREVLASSDGDGSA